jgi:aminoglycoside phosphotransferase (APT) family kinase protein
MVNGTAGRRLLEWCRSQLPDAHDVRIVGIDRVELGHSVEMMLSTVTWRAHGDEHRQDVVLRLRPPEPGLLEPYDLTRQFGILRGLERTEVRAPRALWLEPTGNVLGRPFIVMERLGGAVYETPYGRRARGARRHRDAGQPTRRAHRQDR